MTNEKNILCLLTQCHENFRSKNPNTLGFRKLIHSSEMQNDALMHREGLTLTARGSIFTVVRICRLQTSDSVQ